MDTFKDFLEGLKNEIDCELDCELIIGDVDMPASFVWDASTITITEYGYEKWKPIWDSEYKVLANGTIELDCNDWKLGERFVRAVAGYISETEYNKMFTEGSDSK